MKPSMKGSRTLSTAHLGRLPEWPNKNKATSIEISAQA